MKIANAQIFGTFIVLEAFPPQWQTNNMCSGIFSTTRMLVKKQMIYFVLRRVCSIFVFQINAFGP